MTMSAEKKKYEDMTEKELLIEILKSQKQDAKSEKVSAVANGLLVVVLIAALAILLPPVLKTLAVVNTTLETTNGILAQATVTIEQANTAVAEVGTFIGSAEGTLEDLGTVLDSVNTLVVDNTGYLTESMENLSNIDFEGLNNSISSLESIVTPLAKMMKVFD